MQIEKALIEECIKGNEHAVHKLYKECYPLMKGISMRYQKNSIDAENAFNQGFMKALKNLKKYDQSKSFKSWFSRVIINVNIDIYRATKRHQELVVYKESISDHEMSNPSIFDSDLKIEKEQLLKMIKSLTPMSYQVFNLYAVDGYSHREISQQLQISEGTSKWHLSVARKVLRKKVSEYLQMKKQAI